MPLLWISLAFLAGLVLGNSFPWPGSHWLIAAAASLLLCLPLGRLPDRAPFLSRLRWAGRKEPQLFVAPLLLLTFLTLGAARISFSGPDLANGHVAAYNDQGAFRITAVVDAPPDRRDSSTLFRLRVEQIAPLDEEGKPGPARAAHGLVLALIPGRADWQYGDRLSLDSTPVTPPENEGF